MVHYQERVAMDDVDVLIERDWLKMRGICSTDTQWI